MLRAIYGQPMWVVLAELCVAVVGWSFMRVQFGKTRLISHWWQKINAAVLLAAVGMIFYATVINREKAEYEIVLVPFQSFLDAREQPEMYRTMLMNVLLFLPFGLAVSNILPAKWSVWLRIVLTALVGAVLSCLVEWMQYICSLGRVEIDDVICNTVGALSGALSLMICVKRK